MLGLGVTALIASFISGMRGTRLQLRRRSKLILIQGSADRLSFSVAKTFTSRRLTWQT